MGKRTDTQQQTDGELGFTDSASPYNDTTPPGAEQHMARNAPSRLAGWVAATATGVVAATAAAGAAAGVACAHVVAGALQPFGATPR